MAPKQRKTGLRLVVERGARPFGGGVALAAIAATATAMHVVAAMARHALRGQSVPDFVDMAGCAGYVRVCSAQRKVGLRVVETNIGPATVLAMTAAAIIAEAFLVRLLLAVTCDALRWRVTEFLPCLVARRTVDARVGTVQREVGVRVIECVGVQTNDVGGAAPTR